MPSYALGNYQYDLVVDNGVAKFKFWDPEDSSNSSEVTVQKSDYPENVTQADSREVSEIAYAKVQEVLNKKRDARLLKEKNDQQAQDTAQEQKTREAAGDFLSHAEHGVSKPDEVKKDKDGNVTANVYKTEAPDKN